MHVWRGAVCGKVWYRDLPVKVLSPIPKERMLRGVASQDEVAGIVEDHLFEPYRSLFLWLLDLAVDVVANAQHNKMDAKNMAVVLCPNLYQNDVQSPDALLVQQSLLKFTEFAIRHRIEYREEHPVRGINDSLALEAGLAKCSGSPCRPCFASMSPP